MLTLLYGAAAAARRRWHMRHPEARRRLRRPVVSIGALAVGGRGKTPVTALVAALLRDAGERPAILSRGYGRRDRAAGVVVVRDAAAIRATAAAAGDEPSLLAAQLDGVRVLVADDRYLAGRLAETRLDASVHLLDDGFQHLALDRDLDLLLAAPADPDEPTLPRGRLRERPAAAQGADALVVDTPDAALAAQVGARLGMARVFTLHRTLGPLRAVETAGGDAARPRRRGLRGRRDDGDAPAVRAGHGPGQRGQPGDRRADPRDGGADAATRRHRWDGAAAGSAAAGPPGSPPGVRVLAVAGIADPERFPAALRAAGFDVADACLVPDHHWFTAADGRRIRARAAACGAGLVVTTEKDAVRLASCAPDDLPIAAAPLRVAVEPAAAFRAWLLARVAAAAGAGR